MPPTAEQVPDVPLEERKSDDLVKQVQKLRWMGLEEEANRIQRFLSEIPPSGSVFATPREAD